MGAPYIGHSGDAILLLKTILEEERQAGCCFSSNYVSTYECTLTEALESVLDALERSVI